MTLLLLGQGLGLGLAAAAQPGAFQAFLLAEALRNGWKRTLPLALAPLLSDGPVLTVLFLLLSRLPEEFLVVLRLLGGLFLLYLAVEILRRLRRPPVEVRAAAYAGLVKGAVTNFLNPAPWLFWALVGSPIVLEAWRRQPTAGLAFVFGFYLLLVTGTALLIVLFGTARRLGAGVRRALEAVSMVALTSLGLYQFIRGVQLL